MPEYIKALIAILLVGSATFYFAKPLFLALGMPDSAYDLRRKCWYLVTLAAFLSMNFWVFVLVLMGVLSYVKKRDQNNIAIYFFLILTIPLVKADLPGFAGVRYLIEIDYLRVVSMMLLLPLCLQQWHQKAKNATGQSLAVCDALLLGYQVLTVILHFQSDDFIGTIRFAIYSVLDVVIPYYAISRGVNKIEDFKNILLGFALSGLVVAAVAIFEFTKRWLVYTAVSDALDLGWAVTYLDRGDLLRVMASSGHPIVLGYDLLAVIGAFLYIRSGSSGGWRYAAAFLVILTGEVVTLSKGPWVGLALMVFVLILTAEESARKLVYAVVGCFVGSVFLLSTDVGSKAIEFLPFVGQLDEGSATYRQLLFDKSMDAIANHPWFGSTDYLYQMEELRQGQGIIDLVNTYLIVALDFGLVGLSLFAGYLILVLLHTYSSVKLYTRGSNQEALGRTLLAILLGLMLVLSVCSPISHIQAVYVGFSALALSYYRMAGKLSS